MELLRRYPSALAWSFAIAYIELVLWLASRVP